MFDGMTSWLAARVAQTDCLLDPDRCDKGLSIGLMVKFPPQIKEYGEARYIIDSGAHSEHTRGISFYTVAGKLRVFFATSNKIWKVSSFAFP